MNETLKATAQHVVDRARTMGATASDALIREEENFSATVRQGNVEKLKESISRSLRLRVFVGKRTATSQTTDLSPAILDKLVDETIEMARLTSEDESGGLPDAQVLATEIPDLQLVDTTWATLSPEDRIELARRAEAASLNADPIITKSDGGMFQWEHSRVALANTLGFLGEYEASAAVLAAAPIAESNGAMEQDYWVSATRHRRQLMSPEEVGRRAAERVIRRVGARKVKTCQVPVIFDPTTARTLVHHVLDAVSGDSIYRGRSFLMNQLGQRVAADAVSIVDDARLPGGLGSSPFDDEGVATQTTPVIVDGVLRNYLHSSYSARKLGARPTGNGNRTSGGSVAVGPTNFYLKEGSYSHDEIVASVQTGLYVVDLLGFGVNAVTGDYSRGITGIWIENGKFSYPVHEVTIAGNLRQMLQDIEMIGNDILFTGSVAAPTIKIRNMVLSGD